ncbi:protein-n(5)-glutamine methyltransferase prmc [hydrocarbon metagenome]|uniref:Protein-n(5)-glutamine methyltransferase prmc n=1 Tax=hydrocarbon metagenome TaxID=938273 RepID=A0A0W8EZR0_9ZZZZ
MVATDINPHAVKMARDAGIAVVRTDLCAALRGLFDLVLFNPPYLPTAPEERMDDWLEYALDGGPDGRRVIAVFLAGVGRVLAPGGRVLLLISSLTGCPEVCRLIRQNGFIPEVIREEWVEGEALLVIRFRNQGD